MAENTNKQALKQKKNDETATVIAGLYGVSAAYVRMVMAGDRENEEILAACIEYKNGKNILVETVKSLIPFTNSYIEPITRKQPVNEAN